MNEKNTDTQPIGTLFETINYNSISDLDRFVSELNKEQSIYCLVQAVQCIYARGGFTMIESEVLSKAIRQLSI